MNENISNLIRFIVCYAKDHETVLTTVRLVKFIYLADFYHARWHDGNSFTNLPWAFVYYGPYCRAVMQEIDDVVANDYVERKEYPSKFASAKDFYLFTCRDQSSETFQSNLPHAIVSELKKAIKRYGDETSALLDYVYFDTEPMMDAQKGDILDFSLVKRPEPTKQIILKKLAKDDIKKARGHIEKLATQFERNSRNLETDSSEANEWRDEVYYKALAYMDEEDLEVGLIGTARIK